MTRWRPALRMARRDLWSHAVLFTVLPLRSAIREGSVVIPLPFGDDVTQLIVGQSDQHRLVARQDFHDRLFKRRFWEIDVRFHRFLIVSINQFRIQLARNAGHMEISEADIGYLSLRRGRLVLGFR